MRVVLPSNHKPVGDGVNWYHYLNYPKANASTEEEIVWGQMWHLSFVFMFFIFIVDNHL